MRFNGAPYLGDAWANAPTAYVVTQSLLNVASTFTGSSVISGQAFTATLAAETGYTLAGVVVTMGGEDITATAYDDTTGEVSIAAATGNIIITASASN
jgi:hypothetical protein